MMMQELTTTRGNPLIDPVMHIWHGEVALYLFLGGIVAGVLVITGWWKLRSPMTPQSRALSVLPWAAPVLLSLGMVFLWLDLEHRMNAFRFYLVFRPASPMSWGSWILLAVYPASILLAWTTTPPDLRAAVLRRLPWRRAAERSSTWAFDHAKGIAAVSVIAGAALGVYTGVLLGTIGARPLWNSAVLGPLFLASGLSTGAAFMLMGRLADRERVLLSRADMGIIVAELVLIAVWLIGLASGGGAAQAGLFTLLGGPYTAAFWTLVVVAGLLAPLLAEWLEHRHRVIPGRFAAALVLLGGLALRWILVSAGQYTGWAAHVAAR